MKNVPIDNNSLAHTSWNCKYHIVFAPKYRRKVFFDRLIPPVSRGDIYYILWKFIGTFQAFYHLKINALEASLELI